MAFNKSKVLESALKFLNQGEVAQAIAEYQQILRHDPKDQATLMTVGDLYARQADLAHAIEYFERLAQVYLDDGFNSKAIAIYKKIGKLAPNELPPLERLADLYVQQGILSEARPLYLQIAEAHLKANRAPKAVEVLHRLLEVEPENLRVQMRLAELYNVMGLKKDSAQTYLNYAQRLFDRGEKDETEKLIERALEVDPTNAAALLLKAKALNANNKTEQAIPILESHPEANAGGEVTNMLVDYELRSGQSQKAAERGRRVLARGHAHYEVLYKVAETLIESDQAIAGLQLLRELRGAMIEAGEQDKFLKSLTAVSERLPGNPEPLEMLVDFCRTTSDPFRLNAALGQLSDAYAAAGNFPRAEALLQELVDRNKDDERVVARLNQLRERAGGAPMAAPEPTPLPENKEEEAEPHVPQASIAVAPVIEETLDDETQRYIAQALTDVDLFSSYGLTQKATHLLENVLQRAPRHTPTLERLLDLHLGAGNDRRTAELAAQLEQIHRERNDHVNADRFGELRRRYSKVAGISESELPAAPAMVSPTPGAPAVAPAAAPGTWSHEANPQVGVPAPHEAAASTTAPPAAPPPAEPPPFEIAPAPAAVSASPVHAAAPLEFEIPLVDLDAVSHEPQEIPLDAVISSAAHVSQPESPAESGELDLSDEWAAVSSEAQDEQPAHAAAQELIAPLELDPIVEPETQPAAAQPVSTTPEDETIAEIRRAANEAVAELSSDVEIVDEEPDHSTGVKAFEIDSNLAQTDLNEDVLAAEPAAEVLQPLTEPVPEAALDPVAEPEAEAPFEIVEAPAEMPVNADALPASLMEFLNEPAPEMVEAPQAELEIELTPEPAHTQRNGEAKTTDEFLSDLAAEFDDSEAPPVESVQASSNQSAPASQPDKIYSQLQEVFAETVPAPKASSVAVPPAASIPAPPMSTARVPEPVEAAGPADSVEHMNELAEVFQEFRSELGEMSDEDEDLETHYNLGIAYREMGLLDEAIGEFQKVAKAIQKGKPFRYEMNCSTMLGLSFMDKGEPMVASLWYKRALATPDLEEESVLALQYDLGLALESAGGLGQAADKFPPG